ncbi:transporter substrate-binding domain-containing protein [Brucella sp. HL-2]|nr:transporter substrate-binding domain-containing protein [Brucella sp. HL-2]MCV9910403.1 transporter substrate-binding domain-containing protein [Brucella sp. HL-2]
MKNVFCIVTAVLIFIFTSVATHSQENMAETIKVGVYVSPPFVVKTDNAFSGMAIDLWADISQRIGKKSEFIEYQNYSDLINAVAASQVEAGVTNLTITEGRAQLVDFTHPWFDAGLRVMIHKEAENALSDIWHGLANAGHLATYAWIAFVILLFTIILTLFDRRFDINFPNRWREGFAESFYNIMSIATSGKTSRKNLFGWIGRIWQAFWMVCGIAIIAYVTSSVTSVMTVAHINRNIENVADLQDKSVGVRAGSVAESYLRSRSIATVPFNHLTEAVAALLNDDVSAIVADAPVLEYYTHTNPREPLEVVGNIFSPDKYGFAFPPKSPLVKPATIAIISAHETEELAKLKSKYFGYKS